MWIRSSNKRRLINADYFHVSKNIGGRQKGILCAAVGSIDVSLALYDTEEQAVEMLNKIQDAVVRGDSGIFEL